mgnify:CR=1 FL=1|tara:strand:- start:423 stop:1082 length:660 start_codon:yes stop_codon:yes gene_type:complete
MIVIINNSENNIGWTKKIKNIMNSLCPESNSVIINGKDEMNNILKKVEHIHGIILSGSATRIREKHCLNKILHNVMPMVELDVPILGICFGHQLISLTYQSKICSFKEMVSGHKQIHFKSDPLFKGIDNPSYMYNAHYDYVEKVPVFFKCLAKDENDIIYAIKHKDKKIYGLQFHPEFSNYGNGLQIYKNFIKMCGYKYRDLNYGDIPDVKHKNSDKFL